MVERLEEMFKSNKNNVLQLKNTKPLSKSDIFELYKELGLEHDLHEGFYDMNKDFIIRRNVKGRIYGQFDLFKI